MFKVRRALFGILLVAACESGDEPRKPVDLDRVAVEPGPSPLRRLTGEQYRNSIRDLLGAEVPMPGDLEADPVVEGLLSVGSSLVTVSPLGAERYEAAAHAVAARMVEDAAMLARHLPCEPAGPNDVGCLEAFVKAFGKRAWRRPLEPAEIERLTMVGLESAQQLGSFEEGIRYIVAALLQSPNFLFRIEIGAGGQLDAWELASRLSYFLTNTMPDDELLAAAENGSLAHRGEAAAQARRLMQKPEAQAGVRNFFAELLQLAGLEGLRKDPQVFEGYYEGFGADAREETLRLITYLVFEKEADYRSYFTTQETFVNGKLALLYGLPEPGGEEFVKVALPASSRRRGLLGHASFLALQAHPVSSSPVLRGRFVRQSLLCGEVPPPPAEFNTGIPEADERARTLRERLMQHVENPACAGCHALMDPIGLAFENFDGVGRYRERDNGAPVDASGTLDDVPFSDAWDLAGAVAEHPDLGYCLGRNLFRYAMGRVESVGEYLFLEQLALYFAQTGYDVKELFLALAGSEAFRGAGGSP